MHAFFKSKGKTEPERLHEYAEHKARRQQLCSSFDAGSIHGELLRDALGLKTLPESDKSEEFPWFGRMLDWGYPPGWIAAEDPKRKILARIEGEDNWFDDSDATIVFDDLAQLFSLDNHSTISSEGNDQPGSESSLPSGGSERSRTRRWAHYQTNLFSSEHLQIYSGVRLPLCNCDGFSMPASDFYHQSCPEDCDYSLPPWRRPGAFSAFGPPGWQEYARQQTDLSPSHHDFSYPPARRIHKIIDADDSDMELSD
ncbi:hypothetical protein K439DRAFT_1635418 [Ramaria rubella]|nr:hypothetical protein K439DRAFT_1635418 [Ramaria rubella]